MKFYLKHIVTWLNNGEIRTIDFQNNKVNVITGDPSKGKSTIIEIIDFCFFSSVNPIVEGDDFIDKIDWFGIVFLINDKEITIARNSKNIKEYYFSSAGEIPKEPYNNFKESNIKNIINSEFSINENVVFPFGGDYIIKGSKISPRYFLLFNTQRRNVLSSNEVLFDKQIGSENRRYQEALVRIFDLSLGVTSIENLILNENIIEKEDRVQRLRGYLSKLEKFKSKNNEELLNLHTSAKKYDLIDNALPFEKSLSQIKEIIKDTSSINFADNSSQLDKLSAKKMKLSMKLNKYKQYKNQYQKYKELLKVNLDSLKPIIYLKEQFPDDLYSSKTNLIFETLSEEFTSIKKYISKRNIPATKDIDQYIKKIEEEIMDVDKSISNLPSQSIEISTKFQNQLIFIGEAKKTLEYIDDSEDEKIEELYEKIENLDQEIKKMRRELKSIDRTDTLDTLSEYMQQIFDDVSFNLSGYSDYKPIFDYKSKLIQLKRIDKKIKLTESDIIKNIGSSSNHLFLHLAFFEALHRIVKKRDVKFIPPFLIIDQPDSPYYEVGDPDSNERATFFKALKTLDNHINYFNQDLKEDFQIIVLEHVKWNEIENEKFENFILVDKEWRGDYGLVPNNISV